MPPEFSSVPNSSLKAATESPLFDASLVVSLQAEEVSKAETSHTSDQVSAPETSLIAEIVHSGNAQEIVVVREEAHIGAEWSNVHVNQSYLLQQEDGSVCEAAIVNELSTEEPKLYEESVQAGMELYSQAVEVYEFCGLVEEVAEETVCASSSAQLPHSPGYEVNLFNALLENTDDYAIKEDLDPSIHAVGESDTIIISQQPMPSSGGNSSHNLSMQKPGVAAVRQHLVLDSNQAVEVAHSSEVCLVQVAAVTSDSFTIEQTHSSTLSETPCSQVNTADLELRDLGDSGAMQTVSPKLGAETAAGSISILSPLVAVTGGGLQSSITVSVPFSGVGKQPSLVQSPGLTVVSATKPEVCVSSGEGTKETPSQSIQNVLVPTKTKSLCPSLSSGVIDPKLLILKPGDTLLKHPPSLLQQVSLQQSVDGKLANTHSSWSEECLPRTISAARSLSKSVALSSLKDQMQGPVSKMSEAAGSIQVQKPALSTITPLQLEQTAHVTLTASTSKFEALTFTKTPTSKAEQASTNVATTTDATPPVTPDTPDTVPNNPTDHPDYMEEEGEDMEDKPEGETELHEDTSGQVSSPDEDSDDEPDEGESTAPNSAHKVRQWISDRVCVNSSPASPSSSSFHGCSSTTDWTTPRRERSSPLRGPHGKFVSPSSIGYGSSSSPPDQAGSQRSRGERHTDMAELAKHEADIEHRTQALKREGFWSMKRLTRLTEPPRPKVHWDYLCEEMQWLSADFAQERRWKRGVARKVVRMVMRHHEDLRQKEEKAKRDEHAKIRRVASSIAKEVRAFWSSVEKVVQYKQQSRLEEKRKKALDLQLDFIVGQTEKYSDLLSKSLAPSRPPETVVAPQKSLPPPIDEDDRDFEPTCEEEDDEETIEVEEQQEGNDAESHQREIELLKEEGTLPLDQLLSTLKLPPPEDLASDEECSNESSSSEEQEEEDGEFTANEDEAEDEEDTIAAQEKVEGNVDHAEELDDLAREGDMSMEELLDRYKGAYASDFEPPSASGSKASSDSEASGDEEEETEEDESDVESNTSSSDSPGDSAEDDESEKDEEESEEEEDDECGDEGMELLLKEGDHSPPSSSSRPKKEISHIAATAESLQPKGYTLATTKVKTPIPFLLHGTLREYQHIGLDWLVTMYEKKLNGILADEMGLGKTIQTIALLAHLACEKGNWGPHLIIVPTSVMLNWEMELKRWCPGFKILTYFGSQKERKLKRQGWTKPNAFHVCITSYKLVLQDHQAFRRKSWRYLILDEAQNIKNFKSQRWQSLLNFNSHRRLLLTGTPLQNSLMELWSLMHFLMPHVFQSHREFKEWFSNPLTGMIEGSQEYNEGLVKRLHKVLRPFLLRRIKADVEKQMPKKYEHVVRCRLSKRQRFLYDDFMAQASTRETLASGHFMSVINILMQLRKVCNHPNLFDPRPIQSPFITQPIVFHTASLVHDALEVPPLKRCDLSMFDFVGLESRVSRYQADVFLPRYKVARPLIQEIADYPEPPPRPRPVRMKVNRMFQPPPKGDNRPVLLMNKPTCSVPPAAQPPITEVASAPTPAPVVQQVVCSVAPTPPPRPSIHPTPQTAVRSSAPKPVATFRPPTATCVASVPSHPSPTPSSIMPQRVLLSPDMQARLPSGEVVSIAQLASLAGRPVSSCQGSKPVTFQLQGNKLTLSGAQIHQVPAATPRPVQGNVMHLVSSGVQHQLISQPAQLTVHTTANTHPPNSPSAAPANRLLHNASPQVTSTVSSQGVVKIVVRQSTGKEGGPVPTLAVAPSPRVAPQAPSSLHPHTNATPVRDTAPLQMAPRTPGPATAHYTLAPPRHPSSTLNHPQPPRPVLKVVQPPPSITELPAQVTTSPSVSKSSLAPRDTSSSNQPSLSTKSKPSVHLKTCPPPRRVPRVPRPPPHSLFYMPWLDDSLKHQRDSRLDFICRVNELHCSAKPVYGREVLDFLTFLPGPRPSPAALSPEGEWGRSGHSSCLFAQWQNKHDLWFRSHGLTDAIHSIEDRLGILSDTIDRYTFVIPPVEAPPISMHCCHPPPSLSHKQTIFSSMLSAQVTPLTRSLHRIQCSMRTQFPDLRLIQYDCGKLQTLHTLLRKLKSGGHRVLIFTQMTRMLDVLEQFLNYHGHIYLRLDGSTRVEQRQALMERFNADRRIFCFILSTRSGGVGVNLTGADTVVFYDSDWNPTMDAQAQDRCHRIGQTRDVHIYRLISERTVEENILKKANQKRMLGDMAIEGGNFTTAFFKQQTIRELFDVNDGEKREVAVELSVPQSEEEEGVNKQSTTILEQALCRAEDEEDIVAASQAKAEQVAELAEFNENIPLDDGGEQEEVEELSKAEQEIAALVEQLTPIERYAMNFLEASLEDVCKEELKQAEEQVEAARKGLDQAKEEGLMLHPSSDDDDDFLATPSASEPSQPTPARRGRKPKDKTVTSTRTSGRLRGASPETEPEHASPGETPERPRCGLRGRGPAKDSGPVSATQSRTDQHKTTSATRLQDSSKSSKASSPARDHQTTKGRTQPNRSHPSPVPSSTTSSPSGGKQQSSAETDCKNSKEGEDERMISELPLDSSCSADQLTKEDDGKDHSAMSSPSTSSRSPRKRQSADGEVLRGLMDDSPSAKVLRKLPGRLVTVVEEKEPRRRRRRGSGTGGGGSLEEVPAEENAAGLLDESIKDNASQSPDEKTKASVCKSPQEQDPSLSVQPQPVRSYPPYSPPHLSPDMPVLRNLPVRRRLETESRMAAQLGEQQQQHLGRGRGGNQSKKTDTPPGKDTTAAAAPATPAAESTINSLMTPIKRKRGRPPKNPPALPQPEIRVAPSAYPISTCEDGNPPLSPKRKRGRPRKDLTATTDAVMEAHNSEVSKVGTSTEPRVLKETPTAAAVNTGQTPSPRSEETADKVSAPAPNPAQSSAAMTAEVSIAAVPVPQVSPPLPVSASTTTSTHVVVSALVTSAHVASAQVSSVSSVSLSTCATTPVTATAPLPPDGTLSSTLPSLKPTTVVSTELDLSSPPTPVKSAEPDSARTTTDATPAASPVLTVSSDCHGKDPASTEPPMTITTASTSQSVAMADKPLTATTTAAVGHLQKDSAASSASSATSIPQALHDASMPLSSEATVSQKPSTTAVTETTQASPSTTTAQVTLAQTSTFNACPTMSSETSATPPLKTTMQSTENTAIPAMPWTHATVTTVPMKPVSSSTPTTEMEAQAQVTSMPGKCSNTSAAPLSQTCTPPSTTSASIDPAEANTVTPTSSSPTEGVKEDVKGAAAVTITAKTAEKTVKTPPAVLVYIDAAETPLTLTMTASSLEKPPAVDTANTATTPAFTTTTKSNSLSVASAAESTAATDIVPSTSSSQCSEDISPHEQNSASEGVSAEASVQAVTKTAPCGDSAERESSESNQEESESKSNSDTVTEMEVGDAEAKTSQAEDKKQDTCKLQAKRRKVEKSSEAKDLESEKDGGGKTKSATCAQKEEPKQQSVEEDIKGEQCPNQKRCLSRQSSQESTCSSSPSSGCSTSTLTRHAHHKRTYENRHPTKRRRIDVTTESTEETKEEGEENEERGEEEEPTATRRRRSRSSSSSSDSDSSESRKRLTRSAKRRLQDQEKEKGSKERKGVKPPRSSERNASNNTSTGGESGSDTSSVRITRKSAGSQPSQDSKAPTNTTPPLSHEPEVLGKRCSALNAAAKLLAMKGRVDTPGHTPRKDLGAKAAGTSTAFSSDKNQKPKSVPASPQSNSLYLTNNKSSGSKPLTPNQTSRSASRSTRRCPGALVPPLEVEYKRSKADEKESGSKKASRGKEGDLERRSSSRGRSACSSMSSDGEGECGGHSSRSRSSSNSSQRTHSISSRNTERRGSLSRAASSGSERERDRSSDRGKSRDKKDKQSQRRESRKDSRWSQKISQEVTSSSGTEGTPDRVLRSVAALAAVQARSPAASTRSSSSQQRNNKT
ncbi:uncharacterized protein srcap [Xenentodon cancila]